MTYNDKGNDPLEQINIVFVQKKLKIRELVI